MVKVCFLRMSDMMVMSFVCENDEKMSMDRVGVIKMTKIYVEELS